MSAITSRLPATASRRRLGVVNGLLLVLLAGAGVAAYMVVSANGTSPSTGTVRTATAQRGVVMSTVSATGTLQAARQLDVGFQSSGTLTAVNVRVGQHVRRGQTLGKIDATAARQTLRQAESSLATAQAQYEQTLTGETPQQRTQDSLSVRQAEMQLASAKAALRSAHQTANTDARASTASVAQAEQQLRIDRGQLKLDLYQRTQDQTPYATVAAAQAAVAVDQDQLAKVQQQQRTDQQNQLFAQTQLTADKNSLATAQSNHDSAGINTYTAAVNNDQDYLNGLQVALQNDGYAVTDAQSALTTDQNRLTALQNDAKTIRGDEQKIAQDQTAIANAKRTAASTRQRDAQSIASAEQQVTSGQLSVRSARVGNAVKQAPPTAAALASAKGSIVQATIAVANARKTLSEATLRAPVAGVIASVNGTVGTAVSGSGSSASSPTASSASSAGGSGTGSSSGFVTLTQLTGMEILASFSETDAAKLRVNQPATVTVDALPSKQLAAHVASISPIAATSSSGVVTYDVIFALDRSAAQLRPGMTANVNVVSSEEDGVVHVPTAAVTGSGSNATVTVLENGKQRRVSVVAGLVGDSSTAILSGLKAGAEVVLPSVSISSGSGSTGFGGTPTTSTNGASRRGGAPGGFGGFGGGFGP